MRRVWSFYDPVSGIFTGRTKVLPNANLLAANTPRGCRAVEGRYNRRTQRVDIETGLVVAYQRPRAEIDAEQRAQQSRLARHRVERLERGQARPLRELAIDPNNAEAKRRLAQINDEIAELRELLKGA